MHNKEFMERRSKKGITFSILQAMCKTSHAMTMKPHEIDKRGKKECSASIT
jgi:hypothetical protein